MSEASSANEHGLISDAGKSADNVAGIGKSQGRVFVRWIVAFVMLAAVVTGFFDRISIAVLFTDKGFNSAIGTNFHPVALGFLMTAFLFAYALSALLLSFLGDLFGARRTLGYAAGVWGVLMFLMGSCNSYVLMAAYRILLGISEGPQFSLISKAIRQWFPAGEQARANSIWMMGSPIGSAIGFPLTVWLVAAFGWRSSFYVLGLISLVFVMPLVLVIMRKPSSDAGTDAHQEVSTSPVSKIEGIRQLLKNPRVWMLCGYGIGMLTFLWGLNGWLPTYLSRARHFNMREMGFYASLPFILMFLAEVASGYLADKTGKCARNSMFGLCSAGILLFFATQVSDAHMSALLIALSAAGLGFGAPTHYALAMRILPSSLTSTGIGVINGIGNLVGAMAPIAIGWLIDRTGSFQVGLLVIVFAGIFGGLSLVPLVRSRI